MGKQRGVALFFALIALLAISLAAVALIRSVDTSTLIAGNLSFKQGATSSSDSGIEAAMNWMTTTQTANNGLDVTSQLSHPFNNTGGVTGFLNPGYYSSSNTIANLTTLTWDNTNSMLVGTDSGGNTTRYIIQRMCGIPNQLIGVSNCLFSGVAVNTSSQAIKTYQQVCQGTGCSSPVSAPMVRITSQTMGPRNTVSYVQAFVY